MVGLRSVAPILAALLVGCGSPVAERALPDDEGFREVRLPPPPDVPAPPQTLGPGDVLAVQVADRPDSRQECLVAIDGRLYYGPLDGVEAAGRTIPELAAELERRLAAFLQQPVVEVQPVRLASRTATVLGEVRRPGIVPLLGDDRVLDLLARSSGLATRGSLLDTERTADVGGAVYVRDGEVLPVDVGALLRGGAPTSNIRVHPGDYLYVPSTLRQEVLVLGAVGVPRAVPFRVAGTLSRAIAAAGGFRPNAHLDRAVVVRGSLARPRAAVFDLDAILEGRRGDLPLEPGDIVYLPGRTGESPRVLLDEFNRSFLTTLARRYANELYEEIDQSLDDR